MLSDRDIKAAPIPPAGRQTKLTDGDGLYLLLRRGADDLPRYLWRFKFRLDGKESTLGLGPWPLVSIETAREQAIEARRQLRAGQSPANVRRERRAEATQEQLNTFGLAAREWMQMKARESADKTRKKREWLFGCLTRLHGKPLSEIKTTDIVAECRRFEAKGQNESAHRIARFIRQVYKHANRVGMVVGHNPAQDIGGKDGGLQPIVVESFAAITDPKKFGALMRAIDSLDSATTRHALQLLALVATRPGEVAGMTWGEVDLNKAEWLVPLKRTKMRKAHWVPLPRQAVELLRAQRAISGDGAYVFPQARSSRRPMSDGTLNAALAKLGYKPGAWDTIDGHHAHGFRSSFSTLLNAHGADPGIIELCLSHGKQDKIAAIYNRHEYQAERRALMQTWADLIDTLKEKARSHG